MACYGIEENLGLSFNTLYSYGIIYLLYFLYLGFFSPSLGLYPSNGYALTLNTLGMSWQFPPLSACIGLLLIAIGIVVGFDIRFKIPTDHEQ